MPLFCRSAPESQNALASPVWVQARLLEVQALLPICAGRTFANAAWSGVAVACSSLVGLYQRTNVVGRRSHRHAARSSSLVLESGAIQTTFAKIIWVLFWELLKRWSINGGSDLDVWQIRRQNQFQKKKFGRNWRPDLWQSKSGLARCKNAVAHPSPQKKWPKCDSRIEAPVVFSRGDG